VITQLSDMLRIKSFKMNFVEKRENILVKLQSCSSLIVLYLFSF